MFLSHTDKTSAFFWFNAKSKHLFSTKSSLHKFKVARFNITYYYKQRLYINWNKNKVTELYTNSEQHDNMIAANKAFVFMILEIVMFILNAAGIFCVNQKLYLIQFFISTILFIFIQLFGRLPVLAKKKFSKFVIIFLSFLLTLITMTILNFHASLTLCFPIIIVLNYHSRKLTHFTFILTLVSALISPILGAYFKFWAVDYFVFLIDIIAPNLINGTLLEPYMIAESKGLLSVLLFISLPQTGFAIVFGTITILANKFNRKNYENQINELREARDKILAGMADIVENRDFNTGGHIKRTSEIVKLLVENLQFDKIEHRTLKNDYAEYVIRTTPMHDLGKISVPDSILTKPGKLTAEEFEIIKKHPQKSYEIIDSILAGLKDSMLMEIAKNIALYHHERYDGSGYPKGLKGHDIPLEARIMAIADVYDALVSKRCYKDSMSHEKACSIIKESMGTHFDPNLWDCFEKAYPKIVEYYSLYDFEKDTSQNIPENSTKSSI